MAGRRDEAFERALDEARRSGRAPDGGGPARRPRLGAGAPIGSAPPSGGEARYGLALDWTGPPDRPPPAQARSSEQSSPPAATPAEIAAELGLGAPLSLARLAVRWRAFVWRNHPDRQPIEEREGANARVAIANALYQQARRELG